MMGVDSMVTFIQREQSLNSYGAKKALAACIRKVLELNLCYFSSDPPMHCDIESIGHTVAFNVLKHDCLDGFVKQR
jgi:hypothetical protein